VGLLLGGVVAALFGIIIGIPALRLKGDYLAIITLGFSEIIRVILLNIDSVLGFKLTYGAASLKNIPKTTTVFNAFLWVGLICFIIHTMMKSRHGRAILSIRDNEIASESCGISTTYFKPWALSAVPFLQAYRRPLFRYMVYSAPHFGFMKSLKSLFGGLGGMGFMLGSVISATVLTALPSCSELFRTTVWLRTRSY
jgi:branched-chain amino acid transport system permease protein